MDKLTEELDGLYNRIHFKGEGAIRNKQEVIDQFLNNMGEDKRFGLTLQINIQGATNDLYKDIIKQIKKIEPDLYFYPDSDLHITVLEVISGNSEFEKDDAQNNKMIELIENALSSIIKFDIEFKGLIVSDAAVLGKGYYRQGLNQIRNKIRELSREENIDVEQRYQRTSAHFTGIRFKSPLKNRSQLLDIVQKYNVAEIGRFRVNELELVIHDWYNRRKEVIKTFTLG
ncbi:2'-5' RNA ligase family protein [Pelosinus sp. sgz500959]|uniref:2'-5' RNA ligase family protein n=1 Tax=Pelosinus sp. sgz500959 TaxID=3242472 RepID=UPI00367273A8